MTAIITHFRKHTPLTAEMIWSIPKVDPHVHVPGAISAETAWELGIRKGFLEVDEKTGTYRDGRNSLGSSDPIGRYSAMFSGPGGNPLILDERGKPIKPQYNFNCLPGDKSIFDGFDAVMATVHGHRHPPGGLQTPEDYDFVLRKYKESCIEQNIRVTELLQNITIAHVLRPELTKKQPQDARTAFFRQTIDIVKEFDEGGVHMRFIHCPNKTAAANVPGSMQERSMEWVRWLKEAEEAAPGIFVAINPAGNEKLEKEGGGPHGMRVAYDMVREMKRGTEAHGGEGEGVEHLMNTIRILKPDRIGHGFQIIESPEAIEEAKALGTTFIMMPSINITLGSPIHVRETSHGDVPSPKLNADGSRISKDIVKTKHIKELSSHPFFPLMRKHGLKIALATDNPEMGGKTYVAQAMDLAGLGQTFSPDCRPLSAEELVTCNLNAIAATFCSPDVKEEYVRDLKKWMSKYHIRVEHPMLDHGQRSQAI